MPDFSLLWKVIVVVAQKDLDQAEQLIGLVESLFTATSISQRITAFRQFLAIIETIEADVEAAINDTASDHLDKLKAIGGGGLAALIKKLEAYLAAHPEAASWILAILGGLLKGV